MKISVLPPEAADAAFADLRRACEALRLEHRILQNGGRIQRLSLSTAKDGLLGVGVVALAGLLLLPAWTTAILGVAAAAAAAVVLDSARHWRSAQTGTAGRIRRDSPLPSLLAAGAALPNAPLLGTEDFLLILRQGEAAAAVAGSGHTRLAHLDALAHGRLAPAWQAWIAAAPPATLARVSGSLLVLGPDGPTAFRPAPETPA